MALTITKSLPKTVVEQPARLHFRRGIELQQWRDPTLKEPPDNSGFREIAAKHQHQEDPRG